jgi:RNA polymerase sigma factor (sigma-70 family)
LHMSTKKNRPKKKIDRDNELLSGIEPMIWSILSKYTNVGKKELEDVKQDTMIFIWKRVIPDFKPSMKTKFSSFAYRCAVNFINRQIKKIFRKQVRDTGAYSTHYEKIEERKLEPVEDARRKISSFEKLMESENRDCIKPMEMRVVKIIMDKPDITQREVALKLGYKYPSAISMMLLRMRRRLEADKLI